MGFQVHSRPLQRGGTPWDYRDLVLRRLSSARSVLDLGTGGGEFMSSLGPMPAIACATEGYHPNTGLALKNLRPRGVEVVRSRFLDVGALVYYLRAIPWEVQGFSVKRFEKELRRVHEEITERGSFEVTTVRFYLVASRG